jgi:hypothetical protein
MQFIEEEHASLFPARQEIVKPPLIKAWQEARSVASDLQFLNWSCNSILKSLAHRSQFEKLFWMGNVRLIVPYFA